MKWTDDEIARVVLSVSDGVMPSRTDLESRGLGGLAGTISHRDGFIALAKRLGLKPKGGGRKRGREVVWTEDAIQMGLQEHIDNFGRMPSANELHEEGQNDLACAISRHGGFRAWAKRLGVKQKGSETHRGQKWERHEAAFFKELGFDVEEQTTKKPFDLLVNSHRVDVKSAKWSDYGKVRGFIFSGLKRGVDCDFFDLVCVFNGVFFTRFVIPSADARVKTITIGSSTAFGGKTQKWSRFRDNVPVQIRATRLPF